MHGHKGLDVWHKSIDFAVQVYTFTKDFPIDEKFSLVSQLKRAVVSIASNISEGAARNSSREYIQFLYIALGSASEIETQLIIASKNTTPAT
ncbi:four helix bundle protein [Prosthecochloris sp. N3]|uniref:Four helix bundle protein n=1 Tax=Prosthecochloris ethylica TaxID=2743976 RepID=A0ABR9XTT2_9CHLB|nr:four helix bundle protein [Prosthecochloris ethylica]MBF0587414.1 four helix bundle protein [Prosthecochloris ethylica]MBF0637428.1 four helix bundle protein [Prosthecochloris ethylica]NUK48591.1 four helix bundle protein [Prosthecochloris ethylica]